MLHQRTQKSSASHPQTQQQSSQFAPRPFAIQAQPETQKPATQEEIENEAFNQNKFEANGLQLKEKSGMIAPEEQERLGVLQAKMNDLLVQRQERTSRNGFNLIGIPIHSPDATGNAPIQTKLGQKSDREGEQQQSPQESSETVSNEGMDLVQRTFQKTNPQSHPVSPIQAKLTIGKPGDKYEQEADSVATKVVEKINAPASGQSTQGQSVQRQEEDQEEEVQAKLEISALQRMEEPKEEDIQAKLIQKRGEEIGGGEASTDLDSAINSARGGGQPLEAGLQRSMGQAMGADFSGVKVHTDAQADQLNRSVQARAFTTGQDVFFRQGEYNPGSRGGQELIAHELTHVVQQSGGAEQGVIQHRVANARNEVLVQGAFAIELSTLKGDDGVRRIETVRFGERPNTQFGASQQDHITAWAMVCENIRVQVMQAGTLIDAVARLVRLMDDYIGVIQNPEMTEARDDLVKTFQLWQEDHDDAGVIDGIQKGIRKFLEGYNLHPSATQLRLGSADRTEGARVKAAKNRVLEFAGMSEEDLSQDGGPRSFARKYADVLRNTFQFNWIIPQTLDAQFGYSKEFGPALVIALTTGLGPLQSAVMGQYNKFVIEDFVNRECFKRNLKQPEIDKVKNYVITKMSQWL